MQCRELSELNVSVVLKFLVKIIYPKINSQFGNFIGQRVSFQSGFFDYVLSVSETSRSIPEMLKK